VGWRERIHALAAAVGVEPNRLLRWLATGLAVALVAVAGLVMWSRSSPAPEVVLPRVGSAGDPGGAVTTTSAVDAATAHAAGAVLRPGVYKLPPGARVTDLLDAAGGPVPDADLDQLNLAAPVADGERIYVPHRGESPPPVAGAPPGPTGPVDLNRATAEELDALPGVGPATAKAIIDHRTKNGRFRSVDDLLEVRGIGEAKLADLRDKVKV
jgi:competence protein ComEA